MRTAAGGVALLILTWGSGIGRADVIAGITVPQEKILAETAVSPFSGNPQTCSQEFNPLSSALVTATCLSSIFNAEAVVTNVSVSNGGIGMGFVLHLDNSALSAEAIGEVTFADKITLDVPGHTGQSGYIAVGSNLSGDITADCYNTDLTLAVVASASLSARAVLGITPNDIAVYDIPIVGAYYGTFDTVDVYPNQTYSFPFAPNVPVRFPVVFGTSYLFEYNLLSQLELGSSAVGEHSSADESIADPPVIQVLDANGQPIPGATVDSLGGVAYPTSPESSVPEPGTGLLFAAGLAAVAGKVRRRFGNSRMSS